MASRFSRYLILPLLLLGVPHPATAQRSKDEAVRHETAGRRYLANKEWKAAAGEFEAALRLDPRGAGALIGLGMAQWGTGDRDAAFRAFQRAAEIDPKAPETHLDIAIALKELGQTARAEAELRTALKLRPGYEEAALALALLRQQGGDPDRAIAEYRSILKSNPRSADAHNWLGVALLQKNALREATAEFRRAIELKPDYVRAYNNLGSTLAQSGDVEEGIQALEKGLKYAPADLQLRINMGMALRSKGDADGALIQFRSLLSEHADSPELLYQYGQTLRQHGDLQDAIAAFEQSLELNPEAQETYYGLGQTLKEFAASVRAHPAPPPATEALKAATQAIARGDLALARQSLEGAIAAGQGSAETYDLLGFVLGRGGDLAGGIEKLRQAIALDPALADAHYNLGVSLWYRGDRSAAAAELDEALRLNPAAANVYSFRGMTRRETGDLARARQMFERAISLDPRNALAYFDLGTTLLREGRLDRAVGQFEAGLNLPDRKGTIPDLDLAIAELRRALSGKPEQAEAYNVLGRMLGASGAEAPQVIAAFEESIRLRPDDPEPRNNLGLVYVQAGEEEKAAAAFRDAIRLRPDYADAHQNLGALLTTSDAAGAVRELETALELQPGLRKAQFNLALAYEASGGRGPQKAIEQLQKLLAADPAYPRAQFVLGRLLLRHADAQGAVERLKTAVSQEPGFGEARYQLGLALSRAGRGAEGAEEIRKSRELIAATESEQAAELDFAEGKAALEHGDAPYAISKLRKVAAYRPSAETYYLLGKALAKDGRTREAADAFRKAVELDPGHAGARAELAAESRDDSRMFESYIRDGKFEQVEPLLRAYLVEHPNAAWGWYTLGYCLYGQRKIGDSIKALAQSLQLDVNNAEAHKVLGRDLMMIGRFDAAKIEFEQGARLSPNSAEMPYNLGKLHSIQDNWADARRNFETALRLDSSYMEAYDGLGLALESLGDDEGAIANYKRAIELNEKRSAGFASPYVNMSALLNRTGDRVAAMEYARRALQTNPSSDRALFQLAKGYEYRGELSQAADALNHAIEINPRASSYYYVLATVCRKLGKAEDGARAMDMFSKLEKESNELDRKRRDWVREGAHE